MKQKPSLPQPRDLRELSTAAAKHLATTVRLAAKNPRVAIEYAQQLLRSTRLGAAATQTTHSEGPADTSTQPTAALRRDHDMMRMIIDQADQGFVGVDLQGGLTFAGSAVTAQWLGEPGPTDTWFSWVARNFPDKAQDVESAWGGLSEQWMPLQVRLDQLPRQLARAEHSFTLSYKPVLDAQELAGVIVILSDASFHAVPQPANPHPPELAQLLRNLLEERVGFRDFVAETDELITAIAAESGSWQRLRHLHTLKGQASAFGLCALASLCHQLESNMQERGSDMTEPELESLQESWKRLKSELAALGAGRPNTLSLARSDYDALLRNIRVGAPHAELQAQAASWVFEPAQPRLEALAEYAQALAARLDKAPLEIHIDSNQVRLDPHAWSQVWQALVHVVRNAVDHGLETRQERAHVFKPETGQLILRAHHQADELCIEIEDRGRGIDWSQVARVARKRGLPHQSTEELKQALWVDGLSTREQTTATSGRGVGLSALRQALAETHGVAEVSSEPGRGTCFRMSWRVDQDRRPRARTRPQAPANDVARRVKGKRRRRSA